MPASALFTLLSKMPTHKPWSRPSDERDPSRGVLLDLQENCDWKMESTVLLHTINPATALDDDMQVQCLPGYQADQPQWTYRRVRKVFCHFDHFREFRHGVESLSHSLIIRVLKTSPRRYSYHLFLRKTAKPCWRMASFLQSRRQETDSV